MTSNGISTQVLTREQAYAIANVVDGSQVALAATVSRMFRNIDLITPAEEIRRQLQQAVEVVSRFIASKIHDIQIFARENPVKFGIIVTFIILGLTSGPIASAILSAIGFDSAGVMGGSLAAAWQSEIGNVAAGTLFAWLQSITMTGDIIFIGEAVGIPLATLGAFMAGKVESFSRLIGQAVEDAWKNRETIMEDMRRFGENAANSFVDAATGIRLAANLAFDNLGDWMMDFGW